jgi:hypothetical protein
VGRYGQSEQVKRKKGCPIEIEGHSVAMMGVPRRAIQDNDFAIQDNELVVQDNDFAIQDNELRFKIMTLRFKITSCDSR